MAENKKSFVLYADIIHTVKKMPDVQAGLLLKTILSYVNDENPTVDDMIVDLVFEPIKQQLKRDLKEWEQKRAERSKAGHVGGVAKASKTKQKLAKHSTATNDVANSSKDKQSVANLAVNVNVNDNVTVNDIDNYNQVREDKFFEILRQKAPKTFLDNQLKTKARQLFNQYKDKKIENLGALINKVVGDMKPDSKVKFYNPGSASYGFMEIEQWEKIKDRTELKFHSYEAV